MWPEENRQMSIKSCPKMISLEIWKILTPLQNLPRNLWDLGKLIAAEGFKKLPKVQKSPNLVTLLSTSFYLILNASAFGLEQIIFYLLCLKIYPYFWSINIFFICKRQLRYFWMGHSRPLLCILTFAVQLNGNKFWCKNCWWLDFNSSKVFSFFL